MEGCDSLLDCQLLFLKSSFVDETGGFCFFVGNVGYCCEGVERAVLFVGAVFW